MSSIRLVLTLQLLFFLNLQLLNYPTLKPPAFLWTEDCVSVSFIKKKKIELVSSFFFFPLVITVISTYLKPFKFYIFPSVFMEEVTRLLAVD